MASLNRVTLLGNVTRDIELKYLQSGMAVTELGMAVNRKYKANSGEFVEEVTFVDVTVWGRTAEVASEYLSKGSQVLIEGRLKLDTWESEGQKRSKLKVVCEQLHLVGSRGGGSGGGKTQRSENQRSDNQRSEFDESEYSHSSGGDVHEHSAAGGPPQDDIPF
jgi:single-strand DNA-binding protein